MDLAESTGPDSCVRCIVVQKYKSKVSDVKSIDGLPEQFTCHTCHDLNPPFYATICTASESKEANLPTYRPVEFRSGYGYDPDQISLELAMEAAGRGCTSCWLLCIGTDNLLREFLEYKVMPQPGDKLALKFGSRLEVRLYLTGEENWTGWLDAFEFYTTGTGTCPWPALSNGNHIPEQLDLEYCLAQVVHWIQQCDQEHEHLPKEVQPPKLPKRVLDLNGDREQKFLSLIETQGLSERYVTLSHCWGQDIPLTTTKSNLADHMAGIEPSRLSRTFQDAIALTRGLSIRYLWIDSLCILQDDAHDWQIESAKMAAVYSNSFLNIAATHAADGEGGLFSARWREFSLRVNQETTIVTKVGIGAQEIKSSEDQDFQVYVRPSLSCCHDDLYPLLDKHPSLKAAPLLTRGWCLQERLLAPRTLHFHAAEMFFECKKYCLCECKLPMQYKQYEKSGPRLLYLEGVAVERSLEVWLKVCGAHLSLCLTKPTDRLPALAGLASAFAARFGWQSSDYMAGLWRAHFPMGLLWYVFPSLTSTARRATPFLAPTWSWASLQAGPAPENLLELSLYNGDPFEVDSRYLMIRLFCTVRGENAYGEVDTGRIKLYGAYVEPRLVTKGTWHSAQSYELRFGEDGLRNEDDSDHLLLLSDIQLEDLFMQRWCPLPFYCLLIGMGWGLVLEPSRKVHGTYERVGVFSGGVKLALFDNADERAFIII